ncbi:MAG: T9SS type A sorting domain-containing protein [Flavobacterium sp.]|nr:T9SS type A sorting domain-containing protein [Flavobacterium sp.]
MRKILLFISILFFGILSTNAQVTSVAIVGEAAGGWPGDPGNPGPTDVHQMTSTNGSDWTLSTITLTTAQAGGGIKFRANNAWATNWGSPSFPTGTAPLGGSNLNCTAGTYSVTFNSDSGVYAFTQIAGGYPTIALVGPATAQGWPNDPQVDAAQLSTTDGITYRTNSVALTANSLKIRQNNNWSVSWGGLSFPTGPQAGQESTNIAVTQAGSYRCVFNRSNGQYTFDFPTVAIVGEAVGGWPGDAGNPGPTDVHQLSTTDGETYTVSNLAVTTASSGGGAKFRQDNAWSTNWGNESFPAASSSNGNNINTVAGIYDVTFTRSTGAFNFSPSLTTASFDKIRFSVYPNPSNTIWNFNIGNETITNIIVTDILGKQIINTNTLQVDNSALNSGIYFAKINTSNKSETIKLIRN